MSAGVSDARLGREPQEGLHTDLPLTVAGASGGLRRGWPPGLGEARAGRGARRLWRASVLLPAQPSGREAGQVVGGGAATDRFHVCVFLQHLSIKGNII